MASDPRIVTVESRDGPYEVRIGTGLLGSAGPMLAERAEPGPALLVTDGNVAPLYLEPVLASLAEAGFRPETVILDPGESAKSLAGAERLYRALLDLSSDRSMAVVALGGGVVGDLAGFAAATWLRGVPWFLLPTTLLAQVDASVGGKTAVNIGAGKNLVGAFHAPRGVAADLSTLVTLDEREFRSGLAEVVKMAVTLDPELFARIEEEPAAFATASAGGTAGAVEASVRAKAAVVSEDERETGRRRVLNFGHTAGHAIEAAAGYGAVLHGEAVAVGMMAAVRLSISRGVLDPGFEGRLGAVLRALGLPVGMDDLAVTPGREELARHLGRDKKNRGRRLAPVLLSEPGRPRVVEDGSVEELLAAIS